MAEQNRTAGDSPNTVLSTIVLLNSVYYFTFLV